MIEFALILPIILFIMLGMVTFGIMINTKVAVTGAAREAARAYAVTQDTGRMRTVAENFLRGSVAASASDFQQGFDRFHDVSYSISGDYVTVTVRYNQPSYVPGLYLLLGGDRMSNRIPLSSSATFKIE